MMSIPGSNITSTLYVWNLHVLPVLYVSLPGNVISTYIGDSIIRGVDSYVCTRDRGSRTVSCLPGAQVGDLPDRVDRLLAPAGVDPVVVVHVGTNDIGKGRRAVLQDKFIEVADKLRSRTSTVVFSGILPVTRASKAKLAEIRGLNAWLKWWCRKEGFRFMGHWQTFWNRWDLFKGRWSSCWRDKTFHVLTRMSLLKLGFECRHAAGDASAPHQPRSPTGLTL
uniref:SGNH hydrolase-type esterase domain-containing protein n=1 Tax=Paramormyrops kingsleyae TaxID=1676925 RepID=A0A3B3QC59_9TELE